MGFLRFVIFLIGLILLIVWAIKRGNKNEPPSYTSTTQSYSKHNETDSEERARKLYSAYTVQSVNKDINADPMLKEAYSKIYECHFEETLKMFPYEEISKEAALFYNAVKNHPSTEQFSPVDVLFLFPVIYLTPAINAHRLGDDPLSLISAFVYAGIKEAEQENISPILCTIYRVLLLSILSELNAIRGNEIIESIEPEKIVDAIILNQRAIKTTVFMIIDADESFIKEHADHYGVSIEAACKILHYEREHMSNEGDTKEKRLMAETAVNTLITHINWSDYLNKTRVMMEKV